MSLSTEEVAKSQPSHIESSTDSPAHVPTYHANIDTSRIDEKKLLRKVDMRLIPWLSLLYLLSFLDRTSIGNAKTVQGLVHNYGGLLGMRWMLGMFEAGLFPGVNYYLSCWYKRSEFGIRAAIFFSAATVSGAFGGLLAAAISKMDGIGGKPAWAWIFILEGLATVLAGAASFWIIQDFPDEAKFLTEEERAFIVRRLQSDDQFSAAGEKLRAKYIFQALKDWKTWLGMLCYAGSDAPLYAFSLFTPSIINQLGYTATPANLLSVPVYTWACILTIGVGYMADRIGNRGVFNLIFFTIGLAGYIILIASRNAALSYFAVYLAASGIYPLIPNTIAWMSNNVEGSYKRSVTLGMIISFGNLNGAVSSNIYRARDKPWYSLGHGIVLMYIVIGWMTSFAFIILLRRENAKRERGERNEVITGVNNGEKSVIESRNGVYSTIEEAKRDKGDDWSGYRYIT
ncbi:unnamed protein product [Rhizoctonia solani]|uniref:Uncharacterized protein n=1 Tax=Rhizoctonia solani TaxID=456999 RepID=A0A8H2XEN4_9AGAM|nr:unnamed protein product [Rhizoctonia solani]